MKKLFLALTLFVLPVFAQAPTIPTKAFAVRNGNGVIDNGTAYPNAIVIPFKDAAAKTALVDALCDLGNYNALDPATRPARAVFANNELQNLLRGKIKENRERIAQAAVVAPDTSNLP